MPLPQRRERATSSLEDAKEAIENNNNLNEDDRHQRLSDSLSGLSEEDRLSLVKPCIRARWIDGLSSVIADVPVKLLDLQFPLHTVLYTDMTENQMVRMMTPLLLKGCNTNTTIGDTLSEFRKYSVVVTDPTTYALMPCLNSTITPDAQVCIYFAQKVIKKNKPAVLKLLLPKLGKKCLKVALIEAFSTNRRVCCEKMIEFTKARTHAPIDLAVRAFLPSPSPRRIILSNNLLPSHRREDDFPSDLPFAIILCCVFGRSTFLEQLLDEATDTTIDLVRKSRAFAKSFCFMPSDVPERITALEAATYFDHSECVKLLLQTGIVIETASAIELLDYCAKNSLNEGAKEIVLGCPNLTSSSCKKILESFLKIGESVEVITLLIERLQGMEDCRGYLDSLIVDCATHRQWRGLSILATGGQALLGNSEAMRNNVESTLQSLVQLDMNSGIVENITKALAVFSADMNLRPALFAVLRNENLVLFSFFLSLNNESVSDSLKDLAQETENEQFLKLICDASSNKVKIEVEEEEEEDDDEEDEEEEEEELDKKPEKQKPTPKTTKAKQPKAKAAKSSSAKPKPAAKKAGKTATKKK